MSLGQKIRQARKEAGLTQAQLAEKCGLAAITIQQYERDKREPRMEQLVAIMDALHVSMLYFFNDPELSRSLDEAKADYQAAQQDRITDPIIQRLLEAMYGKCTKKDVGEDGISFTLSIYGTGKEAVSISDEVFFAISDCIKGTIKSLVTYLGSNPDDDEQEILENIPKLKRILQERRRNHPTDVSGAALENP